MECIQIKEAKYIKDYRIWVSFNTGETGEADLKDFVFKFHIATPLREPSEFAKFHLDEWPTLKWDCGFDIDPEYLYKITTKK